MSLPVFPGKQTFSAATPTGCKRFERGAGAGYKEGGPGGGPERCNTICNTNRK